MHASRRAGPTAIAEGATTRKRSGTRTVNTSRLWRAANNIGPPKELGPIPTLSGNRTEGQAVMCTHVAGA